MKLAIVGPKSEQLPPGQAMSLLYISVALNASLKSSGLLGSILKKVIINSYSIYTAISSQNIQLKFVE